MLIKTARNLASSRNDSLILSHFVLQIFALVNRETFLVGGFADVCCSTPANVETSLRLFLLYRFNVLARPGYLGMVWVIPGHVSRPTPARSICVRFDDWGSEVVAADWRVFTNVAYVPSVASFVWRKEKRATSEGRAKYLLHRGLSRRSET
jgi:hypothetical protein